MEDLLERQWHHIPADEAAEILNTSLERGLDTFEVKHRLEHFGPNVLTPHKGAHPIVRFLKQFNNPLIIILIAAGAVTALVKDPLDASVIFGVVVINSLIGYAQESRAEKAIEALSETMVAEAQTVRAGKVSRLPAAGLVPGDLVQLQAGMRVPADLRLVAARGMQVTEAALTGESLPVEKDAAAVLSRDALLAERRNMAYASTLVTYGTATGVVVSTGDNTEVGRISQLISTARSLETPLTRKLAHFSKVVLVAIIALAALTFAVGIWRGQQWNETLVAAIALAVGMIPEGLPAAVTITLAIGVSRMARRNAVIRHMPAVETLGSTTVICSDKTGTLTQNQMTVTEVMTVGGRYTVTGVGYKPEGEIRGGAEDEALRETLLAGLLCNDSHLAEADGVWSIQGDPTEGALIVSARKAGLGPGPDERLPARLDVIPFDSEHQYMATLHAGGAAYVKGAAEVLLARCSGAMAPSGQIGVCAPDMHRAMEDMASRGMRVIAFARLDAEGRSSLSHDDIRDLTLLGLQGMIDPPRPEAVAAVKACKQAGIAVKMITGDHALTAAAIAREIGLCDCPEGAVLSGSDLEAISDDDLVERAREVNVFARVAPEQKLRLVEALQAGGQVVAMTGDGVNDAPALKQANIGVAMGVTGTDVAKEAADMVLADDNFASIEAAVEEGRGVFDNLTKFIAWTLPTNLGEGLILVAAIILGLTLPILPLQILWINMVTAAALGTTLALEPKEGDIMKRPPRDPRAPILTRIIVWRVVLVSLLMVAGAFGLFEYELAQHASLETTRTVVVNVVVFVELFYLFSSRSLTRSPFQMGFFSSPWVLGGAGLMVLIQLLYTYAPFMNRLFGSPPMSLGLWLDVLGVSFGAFLVIEAEKWVRRRTARAS
ncbi:MAG: cation-transporting P-type ATPase [bacterium]